MLKSLDEMTDYRLMATDGEIGRCHDFLVDDGQWVVRYMVADTHAWLPGRKVLISPVALGHADWAKKSFEVNLTREEIEQSPPLGGDAPIERQFERRVFDHFGWAYYWLGPFHWGPVPSPAALAGVARSELALHGSAEIGDPNLPSLRELQGYKLHSKDGEDAGTLDDLIVDDESWVVSSAVMRLPGLLRSDRVAFSAQWLWQADASSRRIHVSLDGRHLANAPSYDPGKPVNWVRVKQGLDYRGRPVEQQQL